MFCPSDRPGAQTPDDRDTIAAIATAEGEGGIAIIRVSGPDARAVLKAVFSRRGEFAPNRLYHGRVVSRGEVVDEAMAVFMKGPKSYTREDVCELHCHGGRIAARLALSAVLAAGARAAEPGEFTKRAFLNGRIDLSQAEAVMQLISANSEAAARAAVRQLGGGASILVGPVADRLTGLMALIEASDDFPEEIEEEAGKREVSAGLLEAIGALSGMADERAARIVREGASVVLAGRPNVGKSSLLNALLGAERAIVTEIPGTTRDVITEKLTIGGRVAEISDTAGMRETGDAVEKIGVARAARAVAEADVVLMVLDAHEGLSPEDDALLKSADARWVVCVNKLDVGDKIDAGFISRVYHLETVELSALTGVGVSALRDVLARRIGAGEAPLVTERHLALARRAISALEAGRAALLDFPLDVCAVDIAEALSALSEITGENAREAVIDRVFRDFCVGK
jgi:tRNA modification GTPase